MGKKREERKCSPKKNPKIMREEMLSWFKEWRKYYQVKGENILKPRTFIIYLKKRDKISMNNNLPTIVLYSLLILFIV